MEQCEAPAMLRGCMPHRSEAAALTIGASSSGTRWRCIVEGARSRSRGLAGAGSSRAVSGMIANVNPRREGLPR
jgi:hypothetical protein